MPQDDITISAGPRPFPAGLLFYGTGAPSFTAPKGSLYLRADGSTTNDRAYINSNGSTSWVAVTTAS